MRIHERGRRRASSKKFTIKETTSEPAKKIVERRKRA